MARAVERVLRAGGTILLEAGTGTGKTLAYLVPAIASGRRVIVSTGTRNLQDQIFAKDLPFLRETAGIDVRAARMKGRENYLCRWRYADFEREGLLEVAEEAALLPALRDWSGATRTGDRAEMPDFPDRARLWREISARGDTCGGRHCPEFDACWLTVMKREAQAASVVVVNHHLFFADLAVRSAYGSVIPDYDTVIFDEAHLIEEVATLYFGQQVSSTRIEEIARDAERLASAAGGPAKNGGGAAALRMAAQEFFLPLRERLRNEAGRIRFDRPEGGGLALEGPWLALRGALEELGRQAAAHGGEKGEGLVRRVDETVQAVTRILGRSDPGFVYGIEAQGRSVQLSAAPIDVSALLRDTLFDRLHACVLTSATLTVDGSFDFFRSRLGLTECETRVVPTSFDHEAQAVLYLPPTMPEPRDPDFVPAALRQIEALLEVTNGRAFLLFTSYANLARVHEALAARGEYPLFVQGEGSRHVLLDRFRGSRNGVLLGTSSFWHGVDVAGEALSLVVIDKLPFDVPGDPLIAARIDRIRHSGGDPFREYQTPLAVLELKQGLGRLLRSRSDRGILAVLDPRLTTRGYGRTFLRSLPPYRVVRDVAACRHFFAPPEGLRA